MRRMFLVRHYLQASRGGWLSPGPVLLDGVRVFDSDDDRASNRIRDGTALFRRPSRLGQSGLVDAFRPKRPLLIPASPLSAVTVAVTFTLFALPPLLGNRVFVSTIV